MEIILVKPIRGLGAPGDVVTVRDGYGRNYLIPQKVALRATASNKKVFEEQKAEIEAQHQAALASARESAAKVDNIFIGLIRQAGEDGRLFGSVSPKDITSEVEAISGVKVGKSSVIITTPIKYIGSHEVTLELHPEVLVKAIINVSRSETEIKDAKKAHEELIAATTAAA